MDKLEIDTELLLVSGYLNIDEFEQEFKHSISPKCHTKEQFFANGQKLIDIPLHKIIFMDENYISNFTTNQYTTIIPYFNKSLWLYPHIKKITSRTSNITILKQNEIKDNEFFHAIQLQKTTWMLEAISYYKTHLAQKIITILSSKPIKYAWIDFGIFKIFNNDLNLFQDTMKQLPVRYTNSNVPENKITIPGCWYLDNEFNNELEQITWFFCGGFFIGDERSIRIFNNLVRLEVLELLDKSEYFIQEVNIWFRIWRDKCSELFNWYIGDHNYTMFEYTLEKTKYKIPKHIQIQLYNQVKQSSYTNKLINTINLNLSKDKLIQTQLLDSFNNAINIFMTYKWCYALELFSTCLQLYNEYKNQSRSNTQKLPEKLDYIEMYSLLRKGVCYKNLGNTDQAVLTWLECNNKFPSRCDALYEICKIYREIGKNHNAIIFYNAARKIFTSDPKPLLDTLHPEDIKLFDHDLYTFKFHYEHSIIGFYTHEPKHHKTFTKLMRYLPGDMYNSVICNYKYSVPNLSSIAARNGEFKTTFKLGNIIKVIEGIEYEFRPSNPCLIRVYMNPGDNDNYFYIMNVRYVSYYFVPSNGMVLCSGSNKIITINKLLLLDKHFNILYEPYNHTNNTQGITIISDMLETGPMWYGLEDIRLNYNYQTNKIQYIGCYQNPANEYISIGIGYNYPYRNDNVPSIMIDCNEVKQEWYNVKSPYNRDKEKNWVMLDSNHVIYEWHPLTIGCISKNTDCNEVEYGFNVLEKLETPEFFKHLRGSSNGYLDIVTNEIWFICHLVEYCTPRIYYHIFVILDAETHKLKRYSDIFKIECEKIEFVLGLVVDSKEIILSYSKWDTNAGIGIFDREKIENELF